MKYDIQKWRFRLGATIRLTINTMWHHYQPLRCIDNPIACDKIAALISTDSGATAHDHSEKHSAADRRIHSDAFGVCNESYEADPDTKNPRVRSGYLGLSASGEVTAPLVYAHSGNPEDYELLRQRGVDVRGKVVIVRYSNPYSYRGFKALTAERQGAAALIIYSDPAEDGFAQGKVFPDGPWGPESHIQRGAITYDYIVPGDPTTPGWASVPGARHIKPEDARSLPNIPALPLSWHDAKPLLENMNGAEAPKSWQGALPTIRGLRTVHV